MNKKCLDCGELIVGRIDKKFCNHNCKNSYNNKVNSVNNKYVRNVNTLLNRNRRILAKLTTSDSTVISKSQLLQMGFDFHYHTNIQYTKKGESLYFCYDFGYYSFDDEKYVLVKQSEN